MQWNSHVQNSVLVHIPFGSWALARQDMTTYRASLGTRGELRRIAAEAETAIIERVRPWQRKVQPCRLAPHVVVPQWIRSELPPKPRTPPAPPPLPVTSHSVVTDLVTEVVDSVCSVRSFARARFSRDAATAQKSPVAPGTETPLPVVDELPAAGEADVAMQPSFAAELIAPTQSLVPMEGQMLGGAEVPQPATELPKPNEEDTIEAMDTIQEVAPVAEVSAEKIDTAPDPAADEMEVDTGVAVSLSEAPAENSSFEEGAVKEASTGEGDVQAAVPEGTVQTEAAGSSMALPFDQENKDATDQLQVF